MDQNALPQNAPSAPPTPASATLDPSVVNLAKSIRDVESGGNYHATGADGEIGAYQITPKLWSGTASKYGIATPLDQSSPQEQNAFAYNYISDLKNQGYNPAQIASIWNSGNPDPNHAGQGTSAGGAAYDTPKYVNDVYNKYQAYKGQTAAPDASQAGNSALPTYGATFAASPNENLLVAGFKALGNIPSSVYGFGAGLVNMIAHPIQTATTIGQGAIGGVENITGENPGAPDSNQQVANQIGASLNDRYGLGDLFNYVRQTNPQGFDSFLTKLQNTATNDPFGFGADLLTIGMGGAGLIGRGAETAGLIERAGQAVTEPISDIASRAASTVGKKAANILATPDTETIAAAQRAGVELPAGAMTTSPIIQRAEALATLASGSRNYEQIYTNAVEQMNKTAEEIVNSTGGAKDLSSAGENIATGFKAITSQYKKAYESLYDALQSKVGDVAAQTKPALDALDAIIAEKKAVGDTGNLKWFQTKRDVLIGKGYAAPTFTTLRKLKTNIGQLIDAKFADPFVKTNIVQLKRLYGGIEASIGATATATGENGIMALYKDANAAYVKAITLAKSQYSRTIQKLAANGQFDKLAEEMIKPSTPIEDIPRILSVVGDTGTANIRSALLQKVFQGARNGEGDFTQKGILNQIKKFNTADGRNRLQTVLTPEQFQGIQDLGKISDSLGNITKIVSGSQTTYLFRLAAEAGAVGYALLVDLPTGNIVGAAQKLATVGFGEGLSYFVTSPTGQRFLKWAIDHGTQIKADAIAQGLTPPPEAGTTGTNGMDTGNSGGSPNIGTPTTGGNTGGGAQGATPGEATGARGALQGGGEPIGGATGDVVRTGGRSGVGSPNPDAMGSGGGGIIGTGRESNNLSNKIGVTPQQNGSITRGVGGSISTGSGAFTGDTAAGINDTGSTAGVSATPNGNVQGLTEKTFPRNPNLSPADKKIEDAAIKKYLADPSGMLQEYLNKNGKTVNTDKARELFGDVGYNKTNSAAVHEAASAISKDAIDHLIKNTPAGEGFFLAGGSGAGKTSAISGDLSENINKAGFTLDGNLSNFGSAYSKIKSAEEAGHKISVVYVYRNPVEAWNNGVIKRMVSSPTDAGRVVPLTEFLTNTEGSLSTVKKLIEKGIPTFGFENTKTGSVDLSIKEIKKLEIPSGLREALTVDTEKKFGKGLITKDQYEALLKGVPHKNVKELQKLGYSV